MTEAAATRGKKRKRLRGKFREFALAALPKKLAHHWIRSALDLRVPQSNSALQFEIASSLDDLKTALTLVQRNFEREGYAEKVSGSVRLTPYHLLPETLVILAKLDGKIIATISVIPRTRFGIPLDSCFPLESFLTNKGKVVELSALAVDPSVRGQQGLVLYNLMKYMYHCNVDILKANTEVIGVNPKMVPLYEAILLFENIPNTKKVEYDFANGAPVIPMHFSLDSAHQSYGSVYQGKPPHQNVMDFFLMQPPWQFSLPSVDELDAVLPQRNPVRLKEILSWNPEIIRGFSAEKWRAFEELYQRWPDCVQVIREVARAGQ